MGFAQLGNTPYILLETFRKNGEGVRTPVWMAADEEGLYVLSDRQAGKVKRIRNNPQVQLCVCDWRGTIRGEWVAGQARLLTEQREIDIALALLRKKYGWQFRLLAFSSALTGRTDAVFIHISPSAVPA